MDLRNPNLHLVPDLGPGDEDNEVLDTCESVALPPDILDPQNLIEVPLFLGLDALRQLVRVQTPKVLDLHLLFLLLGEVPVSCDCRDALFSAIFPKESSIIVISFFIESIFFP